MVETTAHLTLISSAAPLGALSQAIEEIRRDRAPGLTIDVYLTHLIQQQAVDEAVILASMQRADAVLFDLRGNPDRAVALVQQGHARTQDQGTPFIPVFGGGPTVLCLLRMGGFNLERAFNRRGSQRQDSADTPAMSTNYRRIKQMNEVVEKLGSLLPIGVLRHARNWVRCTQYWTNSGVDNLREMLLFVGKEYADLDVEAAPPVVYPDNGFYDIDRAIYYDNMEDYLADHALEADRPTILVILYGGTTMDACLAGSADLTAALAERANVIPFFADGIGTASALKRHLIKDGQPRLPLDAIVSLQWFPLEGGPLGGDPAVTREVLQALDVPLFTPATSYNRTVTAWESASEGMSPVETLACVTLPEMDGAMEPLYLFGLKALADTAPSGAATMPVPGRGAQIARRVLRRTALRVKRNADKKIAIVLFNYPPGESTLGEASFLDVFASVEVILRRLQAEGYRVDLPDQPLKELFLARGLVHNAQWTGRHVTAEHALRVSGDDYRTWYAALPPSLRQATERVFGPPPGTLMTSNGDILLAGVILGNVLVAIQPSRGVHEDPSKSYHDKALPTHHQYIAFYRYLEAGFEADAVLHVGTHGTLEFTPGKEVALAGVDTPDALLGALPHLYLYHVVNASEAMIAKRRSYAQLLTYASPSFAPAELYGDYLALQDLLDEYEQLARQQAPRRRLVLEAIAAQAETAGIDVPMPTFEGESPVSEDAVAEALHRLHSELTAMQRTAIPVGLHVVGERLSGDALLDYLALVARYDRDGVPSLPRHLAETYGLDYDELVAARAPRLPQLYAAARRMIAAWLDGDRRPDLTMPQATARYLAGVRQDVEASDELGALVHALDGGFVMPNLAGDPVRTPETYPTGRNAYQFDPTRIPTPSALSRGQQIAEETLRQHQQAHGAYPEAVGVILWGFETCKTYGETLGQILGYLGVRLEQGEGYYIQPAPIPLGELGRPRIDVVVNICGFFRDLFPNQVRMLDLAFRQVAALDEPPAMNRVRAHARDVIHQGGDPDLAAGRLFGPPPGEYGNRLSTLIETGTWQDETELARVFIERSQYLYGDGRHGVAAPAQFTSCLGNVDLVTQVRDSHEFEVTDVDHYYEFFGGLAQAAQVVQGGEPPRVLIADTTGEAVEVHDVASAVRRGVATRLLNPQWIDGMLAHDFHGGQVIAGRIEYLVGLEATTRSVGDPTWHRVADRYILDEAMRRRLLENNPYATAEVAQTLGEARQRGYWEPTPEEAQALKEAYLEIESWIEGR
jgi:cobaltochelatase CobN/magnesium chelatase subunit H